ncbi:MAG: TVP38/TMEM64 family protein, partial [Lactobacillus acidophilus]
MHHLSPKASRRLINIATVVCGLIIILLVIYWYRLGIFTDQAKMRAYLANKRIIGPIIFVLIQIVQVVIPIIPGGVSLLG